MKKAGKYVGAFIITVVIICVVFIVKLVSRTKKEEYISIEK